MKGDFAALIMGIAAMCIWIISSLRRDRQRRKYRDQLTKTFSEKEF